MLMKKVKGFLKLKTEICIREYFDGRDIMKIGKFGEVNNISIDTIRHYMDLSLIIPEKKGGHYFFDEYCQTDLELILYYKDLGFSLNEIKELFFYKNLAKSMNHEK
ncbi:MerR family transcriptional regulator, partial [Bacillus pacificus]